MKIWMLKFIYLFNILIFNTKLKNKFKKIINIEGAKLFLKYAQKNIDKKFDILPNEKIYWSLEDDECKYIKNAFPKNPIVEQKKDADVCFKWGMNRLFRFILKNKRCFIAEDSFLRSVTTAADKNAPKEARTAISFTIDDMATHFCGAYISRLEQKLNSEEKLDDVILAQSKKSMQKIVDNYITKYNHQPIYIPEILQTKQNKVLIIDQSFGDYSIIFGGNGKQKDFDRMLFDAVKENPNSLIFVKVHPDALVQRKKRAKGFYSLDNTHYPNVILFAENINPIVVLKNVDKVYVWSSGMGFEALMCGKEVITYGTPFYAGWGVTIDRHPWFQTPELKKRRAKRRTLEELFYYSYVWYSHYVNPKTQKACSIDEAVDYLFECRNQYFKENNIRADF